MLFLAILRFKNADRSKNLLGRDGRVGFDVLDARESVEGRDVVGRELK